jgi:hypothetical protein
MRLLPRSILLPLVLLGGCSWLQSLGGPGKNEFAPPCPRPTLVSDLADITRFNTPSGRDLTEMVVQGRIVGLGGECKYKDSGSPLVETTVTVVAEFQRGPAMQGREMTVPLFIAVTEGDNVLDKRVIEFPVSFSQNVDHVALQSQPVRLVLPTSKTKSPAAFSVIGGFQLSAAELAANRQRTGGR